MLFAIFLLAVTFPFEYDRPLYVGSRPLAMGNAYTSIADEAEAGFWNPAGLIQYQGVKIFASSQVSNRKNYAFDSKCVAYSYRNTAFFWGNKIAIRTKEGTPDFNYYSLARKLNSNIAVGGNIKFRRRHPNSYYQFFGYSRSYDIGILTKFDNEYSSGIMFQDLDNGKYWIDIISLGFSHKNSKKTLFSVDMNFIKNRHIKLEPHIGYEFQLTKRIALRTGMSDKQVTAGAGLELSKLVFDYALIWDNKNGTHFISVQINL